MAGSAQELAEASAQGLLEKRFGKRESRRKPFELAGFLEFCMILKLSTGS